MGRETVDVVEVDGDRTLKKSRSIDTNESRGSRDADGNDSDGGKSLKSVKGTSRLSKLLKRGKRSKTLKSSDSKPNLGGSRDKQHQQADQEQEHDQDQDARHDGYAPLPTGDSYVGGSSLYTQSSTPGGTERSNSQMTSDDEEDGPAVRFPTLVSRQSHQDYLVATSPQVRASATTTIPEAPNSSLHSHTSARSPENLFDQRPLQGTQHAKVMGTKLGLDSSDRSSSRSVSPGSRIKDAFKVNPRKPSPAKDTRDERQPRSSIREGESRPQSQPVIHRPATGFSTTSLPGSLASNGTDDSIPPVPPLPSASTPQIALNGAGLHNKPSLNSIVLSSGDPGKTPVLTATPPTPVLGTDENAPRTPPFKSAKPQSPSPGSSVHRRTRSDSASKQPSKLSQSMTSPLTPTMEEPSQAGRNRNTSQGSAGSTGGFFTSVFSAAQNMTTTLANMGGNAGRPRGTTTGSAADSIPEEKEEAEVETTHDTNVQADAVEAPKPLAIDTMGSGNLSLSHLGITTESPQTMNPEGAGLRSRSGTQVRHEEHSAKMEDASAAEAVSAAYSAPNGVDRPGTAVAEDTSLAVDRPPSQSGSFIAKTPPNGSIYEGESGLRRTGSLRDKLTDRRRRKHRNSSGATIGAAIMASQTALASPTRESLNAKLDGFTYANRKRDKDYHQLFRSVPEDDHLLDDYSCALQRDIILAGRIHVSEGHICFSSNILGWVTNLIISFDEIVAIEKESTAMVFPNAIAIQTLHARHTFRSLLSREATYDLMISVWKTNHPKLQTSETGTKLLSGADAIVAENAAGDQDSGDEDEDESEDGEDDDEDSLESHSGSAGRSETGAAAPTSPTRKASQMAQDIGSAAAQGPTMTERQASTAAAGAAATAEKDYPGPAAHAPTECGDSSLYFENILKDDVIPAPLGKIYSMIFGPASGGFMTRWLLDEEKCWDIEVQGGGQLKALDNDNKSRTFTYMKPLYGAIGPKQTKCIVKEDLDLFDFDKGVAVTVTTQTPDVPSGNVFASKTRYLLSWGPGNGTKLHMSFFTEWSGKSWIKGPIEKGSKDGQGSYADNLVKALKAGVSSGPRARAGSKGKKSKKGKKGEVQSGSEAAVGGSKGRPGKKEDDWGLLDPLRPVLAPVVDPIKPLFSARSLCVFLVFLLTISWFRNSRMRASTRQLDLEPLSGHWTGPAGYDSVWRSEEEALWKWLEERVGTKDGVPVVDGEKANADASKFARKARQQALRGRGDPDSMSVREIEYALRVTKEKLGNLERIVGAHSQAPANQPETFAEKAQELEA